SHPALVEFFQDLIVGDRSTDHREPRLFSYDTDPAAPWFPFWPERGLRAASVASQEALEREKYAPAPGRLPRRHAPARPLGVRTGPSLVARSQPQRGKSLSTARSLA